jgi:hypothetical protein
LSSRVASSSSRDFCSSRWLYSHLRRLVEDVHHLVEPGRLLLHDGGDEDARGGAPDGTGELRLREVDQIGVGGELVERVEAAPARVREERLARSLRPEEAPGEREEILHRGAATP